MKEMFGTYIYYWKENNVDRILQTFKIDPELLKKLNKVYPRGYCGVDKMGRPIYIERSGFVDPVKVWELVDVETFMQ